METLNLMTRGNKKMSMYVKNTTILSGTVVCSSKGCGTWNGFYEEKIGSVTLKKGLYCLDDVLYMMLEAVQFSSRYHGASYFAKDVRIDDNSIVLTNDCVSAGYGHINYRIGNEPMLYLSSIKDIENKTSDIPSESIETLEREIAKIKTLLT